MRPLIASLLLCASGCSLMTIPRGKNKSPPLASKGDCDDGDPVWAMIFDGAAMVVGGLMAIDGLTGSRLVYEPNAKLDRGTAIGGAAFFLVFGGSFVYGATHIQHCYPDQQKGAPRRR